MASDEGGSTVPSRRAFLRATGAAAAASALAGCDGAPTEGNETDGTDPGTMGGGGGGDGGGEGGTTPLVARVAGVDTAFAAEIGGEVASMFAAESYTRLEGSILGLDAPSDATPVGHAVTYGHEFSPTDEAAAVPTLRRLSAGVLSLPAPGADVNPLVEASLRDLVARGEGNLLLAAAGLGRTVEWVGEPVAIDGGGEEAPRSGTVEVEIDDEPRRVEVRTFVGAVRAEPGPGMPESEADGYLGPEAVPAPYMTTVHVARTVVGGDLVMSGMVAGWPRPPGTIDPPPSEMDEDVTELLANVYETVVRAELFRRVLGEKGMLAGAAMPDEEERERRKPEQEVVDRSYSATVGLDDDDQVELGYPEENVDDGHVYNSFTRNRDMPGLFSRAEYDPEEHSRGTAYLVKADARTTTYPVEGEEGRAVPVGVAASPLVEVEDEQRNEMATDSLEDLFDFANVPFDAMRRAAETNNFGVGNFSEIERLSNERLLGETGDFAGFEATIGPRSGDDSAATNGTLYVGRVRTADEVVVAVTFSRDGGGGHFDDPASIAALFEEVIDRVVFDPNTPPGWVDADIEDSNAVQICRDTRLETGAGDVLGQPDPPLVEGRNTAVPFDVSTWSGTAFSSYADPLHGVFTFDVGDRSSDFQTVLGGSALTDLDDDNVDPDVLFDGNRQDSNPDNDLPVFELQSGDDEIRLEARAPSGHVYDSRTLTSGSDFETTSFEALRVGFITVVDPEDGTNYGDNNGDPVDYEETVESAFEYLRRTYPSGIAAYRHDGAIEGITFALNDNATQNETKDYRNARVALERIAKPGNNNWSYSGTTMAHGLSEGQARSDIRSNGFDVWVLVPPNGYYQFHRDGRPSGLAPWNDDLAVTTIEGDRNGRARAAETVAQEIGHRIERSPYRNPSSSGSNGPNPLAQRDDGGTNKANRDFDHARHLSSNNDGSTPTDVPGLVSRAYSLVDGEFVVPNATRWNNGFDVASISNFPSWNPGYGPGSDGSRLGRLGSYMSYSGRPVWADSLISRDVVESDFTRESGNYQTKNVMFGGLNQVNLSLAGRGAVPSGPATAEPSLSSLTAHEGRLRGPDERRLAEAEATVSVAMLGPEGTVVAQTEAVASGGVYGHEVEDGRLFGDTAFAVEFPPDAVELAVDAPNGSLTENPITRPLRDAVVGLPPAAFAEDPEAVVERLRGTLDDVERLMDEGDYAGARDGLVTVREEEVPTVLDPEFEPSANHYDRQRLGALVDEMIGRLEGLAGDGDPTGDVEVGEAPVWADWIPAPETLSGLAGETGVWQYSVDAVVTGGDFTEKATIQDPMANPLSLGLVAEAVWLEVQAAGLDEAVLGEALVGDDVDPSQVPAETGLLFGDVAVYLGQFDVGSIDELVAGGDVARTDVADVFVHEQSETYFAYGEGYVVLARSPGQVRTTLATAAGEGERWRDADEEVAWLFGAGAGGEFTLVAHDESGVSVDGGGVGVDVSAFGDSTGLVQSASLSGQRLADATTGVAYPPETSPELSALRETLGVGADDRTFAQEGRFVQVRASYDGPLGE